MADWNDRPGEVRPEAMGAKLSLEVLLDIRQLLIGMRHELSFATGSAEKVGRAGVVAGSSARD